MPEREHVLLINLGRGNPQTPMGYAETTYSFSDGSAVTTSLAGLALWRWLIRHGQAPRSVVFACTAVAWHDKQRAVHDEIRKLDLPAERLEDPIPLEIPRSPEQVWATFPPIEQWLTRQGATPENPLTLHMDLTHAYRAIPIAHTWMALYLQRRGMIIPGVWGYGAFELGVPGPTPFLDLSHLLDLAEWATAIDDFRRRFDTHRLGQLLSRNERQESGKRALDGTLSQEEINVRRHLRKLFEAARAAGETFAVGLPIETGLEIAAHLADTTGEQVEHSAGQWRPALAPVLRSLFDELHPLAVDLPAKMKGKTRKEEFALTGGEIDRQLRLVKVWLEVGAVGDALQALRELVVNRVLLALDTGTGKGGWLSERTRQDAEELLKGVRPPRKGDPPAPARDARNLAVIGDLWDQICNTRNDFAHVGMSQGVVLPASRRQQAAKLVEEFSRLVWADEATADWALPGVTPKRST
ncbi:MAG TPA: TM1812 family CRISPR-associated protein [Thermoanaerobaculaceae bacterium]|nr:TM1812 family CRISPR-associated protein [Thermoanaerobaculaceae bacterium]HRS15456.1 TM1812 family CRISPR-associated protein [Thermoanaerobaculaceae bacterium]